MSHPTPTNATILSTDAAASSKSLSTVSKMYNINGDGKLDEVEVAMRAMDASNRGHLTNDEFYPMMQ